MDSLPTTHSALQGSEGRRSHCLPAAPHLEMEVGRVGAGSDQSFQPRGVEENVCLHLSFHFNTVIWFLFCNV